jgi:mediator of RNA polymerase II transcription subunit 16
MFIFCSLYFVDGHFLLAVSNGDLSMPIQCYKVSVKKHDDKCIITSQSLLSFFLFEAPPEALSKWKILLLFMNFT